MKFLLLAAICSLSAFASSDISKFRGQVYAKADFDLCLQDYDLTIRNMESQAGFSVLDGGCVASGRENFRMEFDYLHPLAKEVEFLSVKFSDQAICKKSIETSKKELLASGNVFITSYCEGSQLTNHFIDTTYSVVRSLTKLGKFHTEGECLNFISDLSAKGKVHKIHPFMSYCEKNDTYFLPVFNFMSVFSVDVAVISGKTSATASECSQSRNEVESNFSNNKVKIVAAFCAETLNNEKSFQETILYIKPHKELRFVQEYSGVVESTQEACEAKLDSIVSTFNASGTAVIYSFCKPTGMKAYKPVISYIKVLEL